MLNDSELSYAIINNVEVNFVTKPQRFLLSTSILLEGKVKLNQSFHLGGKFISSSQMTNSK